MMQAAHVTILYQDDHCVVVEKPGGLLAVPGRGPDKQDSVVERVKRLFPWCIKQPAVHRLDMATSGLMVLGLTSAAHRHLSRQFAQGQVAKQYHALLEGSLAGSSGTIRLRFRLDPANRPYQVYDPVLGKEGVTRWRTLAVSGERTLVEFEPLTGRTHQLRLHASHPLGLGCPIVGDTLYGRGRAGEPMLLHAVALGFTHPVSECQLHFSSPRFFGLGTP